MSDFPKGCSVLFGASGGLGLAIARRMAELGADQVLTYRRNADALSTLVAELETKGRRVELRQCDCTDIESVRRVLDAAQATFGRVHSVLSATGLAYEFKCLADHDPAAFREVIDTDVIGFFNIAKCTVALMRKSGGGSIVTVGTAGIAKTVHGNTLSTVPKTAVARMVRLLALEEGRHNIRVNLVGAGLYRAGMTAAMEAQGKLGKITLDDFARMQIPLLRPGEPEELANMVAFLASSRAAYVTGQVVHVDGGLSA
ncbi:MAG: SDR family NAD(P)-dependent oxidoreductase [Steroidobacteraceae bacterium]